MKYMKPSGLFSRNDVADFLDSLPDSFEIVQPGMTQVRWPEGLTRDRLIYLAESRAATEGNYTNVIRTKETVARDDALKALAAIAPEEKKQRKVGVWKRDGYSVPAEVALVPVEETPTFCSLGWRKVGECEVTE